jgi:hypothetical protein
VCMYVFVSVDVGATGRALRVCVCVLVDVGATDRALRV